MSYDVGLTRRKYLPLRAGEKLSALHAGDGSVQIHVVLNWFEELKRLVPTN